MAAVALAGATASLPAAAAPPPAAARAPMRHTTAALRSLRPLLTLAERGAIQALIDAGLSYETGAGIVSYSRWASVAKISRRQAMRYGVRFKARGILVIEHRFWKERRVGGDMNRANWLFLPIVPPFVPDSELPPEAYLDDNHPDFEPPDTGVADALDASSSPPAAPLADTRPRPENATARVAVASSCDPGATSKADASMPVESGDAACILGQLRSFHELASIADPTTAERLAAVAKRNGKALVLVNAAIAAAVDKAAGREGRELESFLSSLIRAEDGRSLKAKRAEPAPLSPEEKARRRAEEAELKRRFDERGEAELQRRLRASQALRGPP